MQYEDRVETLIQHGNLLRQSNFSGARTFFSSSNEQHEGTKEKQAKTGETVEFTDWLEHYDYFKEARIKVKKKFDEKLKMIDKLLNVLKNKMNEWMFSSMSCGIFFYFSRNLIDFPD